jgi:hypothetical protein
VSAGFPVAQLQGGELSAGATLKYVVGHELAHGVDAGSVVGPAATIDVTFPMVTTAASASFGNIGSGLGIDLGAALRRPDLTVGARLENLVQTFSWNEERLRFRDGRAILTRDTQFADASEEPYANAPDALKRFVEGRSFAPMLSLGVALDPTAQVTVAGDVRLRLGDEGLDPTPALHVGAGGEWRWSVLSLRGGAAVLSHGFQISGGIGAALGPARLGTALLLRDSDAGTALVGMLTLFSAAW